MIEVKWSNRFVEVAKLVSTWSKDPSTKVGAVLVSNRKILGTGYNGFPPGEDDSEHLYADREYKLAHVIHAEENAIKNSTSADGADLYVTLFPCDKCAEKIVAAGIKRVLFPSIPPATKARWAESFEKSRKILEAGKVEMVDLG